MLFHSIFVIFVHISLSDGLEPIVSTFYFLESSPVTFWKLHVIYFVVVVWINLPRSTRNFPISFLTKKQKRNCHLFEPHISCSEPNSSWHRVLCSFYLSSLSNWKKIGNCIFSDLVSCLTSLFNQLKNGAIDLANNFCVVSIYCWLQSDIYDYKFHI